MFTCTRVYRCARPSEPSIFRRRNVRAIRLTAGHKFGTWHDFLALSPLSFASWKYLEFIPVSLFLSTPISPFSERSSISSSFSFLMMMRFSKFQGHRCIHISFPSEAKPILIAYFYYRGISLLVWVTKLRLVFQTYIYIWKKRNWFHIVIKFIFENGMIEYVSLLGILGIRESLWSNFLEEFSSSIYERAHVRVAMFFEILLFSKRRDKVKVSRSLMKRKES